MSDIEKQDKHLLNEALHILEMQYDSNEDFNNCFDGEELVSIQSQKQDVDDYKYEPSKILFWVDRDAYETELDAWSNEKIYVQHKEVIELIRTNGHITVFNELQESIRRGRIVPFIGAGMSVPMGMPLWKEALQQLLTRLRLRTPDSKSISNLIDTGRYLEAAQKLKEHSRAMTESFIRTTYRI
jgi:hypothetical protein